MSPRQVLVALAAVFVIAGIVLGMRNISSDDVSCGSAFSPSSSAARIADGAEEVAGTLEGATPDTDNSNQDACDSAVSDAKPFAYGALGLGAIALIGGFVASPNKPTNSDGSAKPSIWR